jgi:hypothetical protein
VDGSTPTTSLDRRPASGETTPTGALGCSEQEGLTGAKGSILRRVVVDKTRSSLESALASIKRSVEQSAPRR